MGQGQQAATVPASSAIYDKIESVSAFFPGGDVALGERPMSRRDVERIIGQLQRAVDSAAASVSPETIAWARTELSEAAAALSSRRTTMGVGSTILGASLRTELFSSDARTERIMSNGMGMIDATTHPYALRRDGWPTGPGTVQTIAPTVFVAGRRWALVAEPRFSAGSFRDHSRAEDAFLHRAYARAVVHNVAIQAGRDERIWGQSPVSALFLSGNASPIPAIVIGTDTSITLPWWFRVAGPVRFTAMLGDLGQSFDPPHARLAGWQMSMMPWPRFELGVAVLAQTGGGDCERRSTCASLFKRVVDLFPVIDALAPQHADLQISNKLAGGNLRLRFPELSGLDFYYELQIDDFDGRRLRSSFVDDAAHLLGIRVPHRIGDDWLTWRAEWHRTSLRLYEHGQYLSGATYRGQIFGDPLGPNAHGASLAGRWQLSPVRSLEVTFADERRDPSHYIVLVTGPRDRGFIFVRDIVRPDHRRRRGVMSWSQPLGPGALRITAGYNRSWQEGQAGRNEWLGIITLSTQRLRTF